MELLDESSPKLQSLKVDEALTDFTCPICLDCPSSLHELATISSCTHKFCFECIGTWAKTENRCPCCKARFRTIDRVEPLPLATNGRRGKRKRRLTDNSPVNSHTVQDRNQPSGVTMNIAFIEQILTQFAAVSGEHGGAAMSGLFAGSIGGPRQSFHFSNVGGNNPVMQIQMPGGQLELFLAETEGEGGRPGRGRVRYAVARERTAVSGDNDDTLDEFGRIARARHENSTAGNDEPTPSLETATTHRPSPVVPSRTSPRLRGSRPGLFSRILNIGTGPFSFGATPSTAELGNTTSAETAGQSPFIGTGTAARANSIANSPASGIAGTSDPLRVTLRFMNVPTAANNANPVLQPAISNLGHPPTGTSPTLASRDPSQSLLRQAPRDDGMPSPRRSRRFFRLATNNGESEEEPIDLTD